MQLNVKQLRALAKEIGIEKPYMLKRQQLCDILSEQGVPVYYDLGSKPSQGKPKGHKLRDTVNKYISTKGHKDATADLSGALKNELRNNKELQQRYDTLSQELELARATVAEKTESLSVCAQDLRSCRERAVPMPVPVPVHVPPGSRGAFNAMRLRYGRS